MTEAVQGGATNGSASTSAPSPAHPVRRATLIAYLAVICAAMLPGFVCALVLGSGAFGVGLMGALPALLGTAIGGFRLGALTALIGGLTMIMACAMGPVPMAGTALIAGLCLAVGISAGWGIQSGLTGIPIVAAFMLIAPPVVLNSSDVTSTKYLACLGIAGFLSGIWSTLVVMFFMRKAPNKPPIPNTVGDTVEYTVALTVLSSVAMFFLLTYAPGSNGAWLILTFLVLVQIGPDRSLRKYGNRVIGTVAGALIAAAAAVFLPVWALLPLILIVPIGMAYGTVTGRYALVVTCLTPLVVLPAGISGTSTLTLSESLADAADLQRVVYTLIGALLALAAWGVGRAVRSPHGGAPATASVA